MSFESMLKVLIPLFTFIAGTFVSFISNKNQSKKLVRAYQQVEERHYPFNLNLVNISEKVKVIMCGDYAQLSERYASNPGNEIIYAEVTNLGPGHMLNCVFDIKVNSLNDNHSWDFNVNVPFIKENEMILIPVVSENMTEKRVILSDVRISFLTLNEEKMKYEYRCEVDCNEAVTTYTSQKVKGFFKFKKLYKFEGGSSLFQIMNSKKNIQLKDKHL